MNKIWLILKREYLTNLKKPTFLFSAFGTPVLVIAVFVLAIAIATSGDTMDDLKQVGTIDNAGVLDAEVRSADYPDLFVAYESEEAARAALDAETLDAYVVIPESYIATGQVQLYSYDGVPSDLEDVIDDLLIANLSTQVNTDIPTARLIDPANATIRLADSGRELTPESLPALILMPIIFVVIFMIAMQISGTFVMSGLVEEKTNRLIEVLATTVTPMQLLTGKIIGLGLLGLTQISIWIGMIIVVIALGQDIPLLSGLVIPVDMLVYSVIYFILGYFLIASLLSVVAVIVNSEAESRQYAAIVSLVFVIPVYLTAVFLNDANGPIPTVLSIFPFKSPTSMIMRVGFVSVPLWQMGLSIALLLLTTLFFMWASAKIFRWGLLMYGKKPSLRELIAVIQGNPYKYSQPQTETPTKKEVRAS